MYCQLLKNICRDGFRKFKNYVYLYSTSRNVQTGLKIFLICLYTCIYIVSKIRVLRLKMAPFFLVLKIERVISL